MNAHKKEQQDQGNTKKPFRRIAWIIGIAICVILLLLLSVPWILSSSGGTDFLLGRINKSMDGTLGMKDLSVGWLSGVQIQDLTFEDPTGQTQVKVDSITSHPSLLGLLGGRLTLGKTIVESPDIKITLPPLQTPEETGKPATQAGREKPSELALGSMDLEVRDGRAVIEQLRPSAEPLRLEVRNFTSTVQLQKPGGRSSLDMSMQLADGGTKEATIQAKGAATTTAPRWGLKGLSGQMQMEINSLSLETLRPLMALAGKDVDMGGMLNANADVKISDGQIETLNADAVLDNFQQVIAGKVTRLAQPVKARAKISAEDNNLVIDALSVDSSFCQLDGKGGLNSLDYTLTADLAKTQEVAGSLVDFGGYELQGAFSGKGQLRRSQDTFTVSGTQTIQNFVLQQETKKLALANITQSYNAAIDPSAQTLQITEAAVKAEPGQLRLAGGKIDWGQKALQADMTLTGDVDLQKARPLIEFFYALPAEVSIAGQARPDVALSVKDGMAEIVSRATAIDNLNVSKPGLQPFASKTVTLKADALFNVEKKELVRLSDFELLSDPIKIRGNLQQKTTARQTTVSGEMNAEYTLKEVTTLASPVLPEGLSMTGTRNDKFTFQSTYPADQPEKKMENMQASGGFGFDSADYHGMHVGPTEMKLKADRGVLAVDLSDTKVNDGILRFSGEINLADEPKVLRLRKPMTIIEQVQINDEMTHAFLEYVNPFFAGATRVSGIANFSCDRLAVPLGKTRKDLLQMKSTLGISNLKLRPGGDLAKLMNVIGSEPSATLTLHPTDLLLADQVLSYQDMQLDVGNNPINFAGRIGLDRKLNLTMKLPWTAEGRTIKTGQESASRITLGVGGTIDKPVIDWGKLIQYNLENVLQKEIQDQLEKIFR